MACVGGLVGASGGPGRSVEKGPEWPVAQKPRPREHSFATSLCRQMEGRFDALILHRTHHPACRTPPSTLAPANGIRSGIFPQHPAVTCFFGGSVTTMRPNFLWICCVKYEIVIPFFFWFFLGGGDSPRPGDRVSARFGARNVAGFEVTRGADPRLPSPHFRPAKPLTHRRRTPIDEPQLYFENTGNCHRR